MRQNLSGLHPHGPGRQSRVLRLRHPHRGLPAEQHRQLLQERSGRSFPGGQESRDTTVDNIVDQVTVDISGDDLTPPSKVVDLSGMFVNPDPAKDNSFKLSFTAPGDDLDSQDPVKNYIIKYSQNLTAQNFDSGILLTTEDLVAGSSLTPVDGGQLVEITIK